MSETDQEVHEPGDIDAAITALRKPLAVLEATLGEGGGFLVGRRFTVADMVRQRCFAMPNPRPSYWSTIRR